MSANDAAELEHLNRAMAEQEQRGAAGTALFQEVLDDALVFRRGDGSVIDKSRFLEGLADPGNTSEVLTAETRQLVVTGDQAFAEVIVRLVGRRAGKAVDGSFRNLRLFERQDGSWRCVMWFNKRLPDGS